jgi:hypothetical protein
MPTMTSNAEAAWVRCFRLALPGSSGTSRFRLPGFLTRLLVSWVWHDGFPVLPSIVPAANEHSPVLVDYAGVNQVADLLRGRTLGVFADHALQHLGNLLVCHDFPPRSSRTRMHRTSRTAI